MTASHTDVVYFPKGNFFNVGLIFSMVTSAKASLKEEYLNLCVCIISLVQLSGEHFASKKQKLERDISTLVWQCKIDKVQ